MTLKKVLVKIQEVTFWLILGLAVTAEAWAEVISRLLK